MTKQQQNDAPVLLHIESFLLRLRGSLTPLARSLASALVPAVQYVFIIGTARVFPLPSPVVAQHVLSNFGCILDLQSFLSLQLNYMGARSFI